MGKFDFLFGAVLAQRLLNNTCRQFKQNPAVSSSYRFRGSALRNVNLWARTFRMMRSSEKFDLFRERVILLQEKYGCKSLLCPEKRKLPSYLEVGSSTGYYPSTPKELCSQQYLSACAIRERFDQPGYAMLLKLKSLLLKAAQRRSQLCSKALLQWFWCPNNQTLFWEL